MYTLSEGNSKACWVSDKMDSGLMKLYSERFDFEEVRIRIDYGKFCAMTSFRDSYPKTRLYLTLVLDIVSLLTTYRQRRNTRLT